MANRKHDLDSQSKIAQLGETPSNTMAHNNGLDEIDLWAMQCGQAERKKYSMTPKKKHCCCV